MTNKTDEQILAPTAKKFSIEDLASEPMNIKRTGEQLGFAQVLSKAGGLKNLLVWKEHLPAGRRSSSPHSHSHKEELVIVLSGVLSVRHGDETFQLYPGDAVAFQPGDPRPHVTFNDSAEDVSFLGIASNEADDTVVYEQ